MNEPATPIKTIRVQGLDVMLRDLGTMSWKDAMDACDALGESWVLPNCLELNILYLNKEAIGGFSKVEPSHYWSSLHGLNPAVTENEIVKFYRSFSDGQEYTASIHEKKNVRAIKRTELYKQFSEFEGYDASNINDNINKLFGKVTYEALLSESYTTYEDIKQLMKSPSFIEELIAMLRTEVRINETRINIDSIEILYSDPENGIFEIYVGYTIKAEWTKHTYVYPLYISPNKNDA